MNWAKIKLKLLRWCDLASGFDEQNVIKWPPVTEDMWRNGYVWAQAIDGEFFLVCDTCGGNCGQYGQSKTHGAPSMDRLIQKLHNNARLQ